VIRPARFRDSSFAVAQVVFPEAGRPLKTAITAGGLDRIETAQFGQLRLARHVRRQAAFCMGRRDDEDRWVRKKLTMAAGLVEAVVDSARPGQEPDRKAQSRPPGGFLLQTYGLPPQAEMRSQKSMAAAQEKAKG
jgi:hypothetical protein